MKYELDENEVIKVLTRNAIKCLVCNTVLESKYQHHFVECGCENQTFNDGGLVYTRVGAVDLDLVENLCEYVEMTRGERDKQLEQQKLDQQLKLQERIDNGEMLNVGSDSNPHWVSKQVWEIVMNVSEKYYPKTK
jgi:hypothetical protein